jgi:phosphoenolpyruvate-protein kinase (PTS system EI component)
MAPYPLPHLAALLWDAAAIVTTGGGPAAHLFESARALGIPAVAAIHLDEGLGSDFTEGEGRFALAVDGSAGSVFATEW